MSGGKVGIREGGKVGRRGDWRMGEKRAVYGQQAVLWNWQGGGTMSITNI